MSPDRRSHFANAKVAHAALKGQVEAAQFRSGTLRRVAVPVADLRCDPARAGLDRQVLFGHPLCQLDPVSGFARDETTGYVGYITPQDTQDWSAPTHRVHVRATLLFVAPDFKSPDPIALSCGSLLTVVGQTGRYAQTQDGRFVVADHLVSIAQTEADFAKTAALLIGTPYLWGGNSAFGIDCSGLVQLALQAAGVPCPGDSDQQREALGTDLPEGSTAQRNDLMFWPGHVALVCAPDMLIHTNAHHMAVAYEPIADALARIEAQGDGARLAHKRL